MNQSQIILREVASDPERAINFLKKLQSLMAIQKRNWSRVVIAYLLGILTVLIVNRLFDFIKFNSY
jgi:hypothetical protein